MRTSLLWHRKHSVRLRQAIKEIKVLFVTVSTNLIYLDTDGVELEDIERIDCPLKYYLTSCVYPWKMKIGVSFKYVKSDWILQDPFIKDRLECLDSLSTANALSKPATCSSCEPRWLFRRSFWHTQRAKLLHKRKKSWFRVSILLPKSVYIACQTKGNIF